MTSTRRAAVWLLAAVGVGAVVTPPFIWWLLSDYDRYVRIISGPPFDPFGSGPFQLWLAFSFFSLGFGAFVLACTLVVAGRDGEWTAGARIFARLASSAAARGLLGVLMLLALP